MSLEILPPFKVFYDKGVNPKPLEGGYIYIGEKGLDPETNPQTAYWDSARSIQATQPIRTIGGRPDRGGAPGRIFVANDFSMTVRNSKKELVETDLDNSANLAAGYYFFETIDALKAGDTSDFEGDNILVYVGNGSAQEDDALDYNGGMFEQISGAGTPSTDGFNSRGEYIVTDSQGIQYRCISKSPPGGWMGLHRISSIQSGALSGLITPDLQSETLIGTFISPQSTLYVTTPDFTYSSYFFDPYHKNSTDYRVLNLKVLKDIGTTLGTGPVYRFSSEMHGAFSGAPELPIQLYCNSNAYVSVDYSQVYIKNPVANQYKAELGYNGFYFNASGTDAGIKYLSGEMRIYYGSDAITMTNDAGSQYSNNPITKNHFTTSFKVLIFDNTAVVGNRLDVSGSNTFLYQGVSNVTITHLDHGHLGQEVNLVSDSGAGTITLNAGNILGRTFPVNIPNNGSAVKILCISDGDATGLTSRWRFVD